MWLCLTTGDINRPCLVIRSGVRRGLDVYNASVYLYMYPHSWEPETYGQRSQGVLFSPKTIDSSCNLSQKLISTNKQPVGNA